MHVHMALWIDSTHDSTWMDLLTIPSVPLLAGWPSDTMRYWPEPPRETVGMAAYTGVELVGGELELEETCDRSLSRVCLWSTSRS